MITHYYQYVRIHCKFTFFAKKIVTIFHRYIFCRIHQPYNTVLQIKNVLDGAKYNSNNFLHQQKCTKPLSLIKHDRRLKNNEFASVFNMFRNRFDLCSPFRKIKEDTSYRTHCIEYINLLQARGQMVGSALIQNRGGIQCEKITFFWI